MNKLRSVIVASLAGLAIVWLAGCMHEESAAETGDSGVANETSSDAGATATNEPVDVDPASADGGGEHPEGGEHPTGSENPEGSEHPEGGEHPTGG